MQIDFELINSLFSGMIGVWINIIYEKDKMSILQINNENTIAIIYLT